MSLQTATKLCLQAFDRLCEDFKMYSQDQDALENALDEGRRLRVWAGNLGALAKGHSALDWRLRDASVMRTGILMLLRQIKDLVDSCSAIVSDAKMTSFAGDSDTAGHDSDAISLPSDSDAFENNDSTDKRLDILMESIAESIKNLYKLAYRIRNPNMRVKCSRASRYKEISEDTGLDLFGDHFEPLDRAHVIDLLISLRLESANAAEERTLQRIQVSGNDEALVSRLTESNITRRRQFRYWEKHSEKLAAESYVDARPLIQKVTQMSGATPLDENHQLVHSDKPPGSGNTSKSIHTTTEATRYDPQLDRGDLETQSVISIATTARDLEGRTAELPPPPPAVANGQDFVCPYCFILCPSNNGKGRAWKAHILRDLQPYICTYKDCADGDRLYESRQAWFDHESMTHRQCWRCRDHPSLTFSTQELLEAHLKTSHKEIASDQARTDFSEISEATFDDNRDKCPFCLLATKDILNMPNHLANHLERVATFSLPRHLNDHAEASSGNSDEAIVAMSRTSRAHSWQAGSINFSEKSNTDEDPDMELWEHRIEDVWKDFYRASDAAVQCGESQRANSIAEYEARRKTLHSRVNRGTLRASIRSKGERPKLLQGLGVHTEAGYYGNPLQAACWGGKYDEAKSLLDQGADVNARGGHYGNALQAASFGGYDKIVRLLLNAGANVNAQGGFFGSALQAALSSGHEHMIDVLLNNGAAWNDEGGWGGDALRAACFEGDETIVERLIECGADVNAQGGQYGNALQAACSKGHENIVERLIERGADVNAQGGRYGNALQAACSEGHENIVERLIERGADVNAQGGRYGNALQAACSEGHENIVERLIERGADVNSRGVDYRSPLEAASSEGHDSIVQLLLDHGAVIEYASAPRRTANGRGPVLWAAQNGHNTTVKLLLGAGASVDYQDSDGRTPLMWAVENGHESVVRVLLSAGAAVNYQDRQRRTALSWAAETGHTSVAQLLVEAGAIVDCEDNDGRTPLSWAAEHGQGLVVESLLAAGATLESRDTDGRTSLSWAAEKGQESMVELLIAAGAALESQDKYERTPMWWAAENRHQSIVALLKSAGAAADGV